MVKLSALPRPSRWRELLRPSGPLPRPSRRGFAFDVALVVVLAVIAARYVHDRIPIRHVNGEELPFRFNDWFGPIAFLVIALGALVWRRRIPLTVLWLVTLATALLEHDMPQLGFVLCVIAGYSAAAYSPFRVPTMLSLAAAVLAVASLSPNVFQDVPGPQPPVGVEPSVGAEPTDETAAHNPYPDRMMEEQIARDRAREGAESVVPDEYVPSLILIPIVLAASAIRVWKTRVSTSRAELSRLEAERAEELRRAAERERARIARELHDVVTHNVSVMVIQTGAARKIMDTRPDQAKSALLSVEAGGRAAMSELRHVMGLLTMSETADPTDDLTPQPSLAGLDALVARLRDSGTEIELTVTGEVRPLPSGIELAAYRVVQEALTNAVKHADGARVDVTVDHRPDRLSVRVTDSGGPPGPAAATGNGRGLLGLRERLAVYDGTLTTGPRPGGGFAVEAVIPLTP